jgi:pyocin large subunit-like protein
VHQFTNFLRLVSLLILFATLCGCSSSGTQSGTLTASPQAASNASQSPKIEFDRSIGFSTYDKWQDHFKKHAAEFGQITAEQYLEMAQKLRDQPASQDIVEFERKDHVTSRFQRSSGNFLAFNRNRTIRTFFKPKDGERYFRRQAKKDHD